jgi:hypothetical protein
MDCFGFDQDAGGRLGDFFGRHGGSWAKAERALAVIFRPAAAAAASKDFAALRKRFHFA